MNTFVSLTLTIIYSITIKTSNMLSRFFSRIINFFLQNCVKKSSSSMTTDSNRDYSLKDLPDDFLDFLLEHNESMLKNEPRIAALPEQVAKIQTHTENILREQHRRKFLYCLDEIHILHKYKENKKEWVVRWLDQIDLNSIELLDACIQVRDPLEQGSEED